MFPILPRNCNWIYKKPYVIERMYDYIRTAQKWTVHFSSVLPSPSSHLFHTLGGTLLFVPRKLSCAEFLLQFLFSHSVILPFLSKHFRNILITFLATEAFVNALWNNKRYRTLIPNTSRLSRSVIFTAMYLRNELQAVTFVIFPSQAYVKEQVMDSTASHLYVYCQTRWYAFNKVHHISGNCENLPWRLLLSSKLLPLKVFRIVMPKIYFFWFLILLVVNYSCTCQYMRVFLHNRIGW